MDKYSVEINETGKQFADFFEAVPMPLIISRISDGLIFFANKLFADTLGMAPEALANHHTPNFYHDPHDREMIVKDIREKGHVENRELLIQRADGTLRWILLSMRPITFEGTPALLSGFHDITEHKEAELALERERQLQHTLINQLPDLIYVKDNQNRFVTANQALARSVGADAPEEMVGRTDFDFFPKDLAAQYFADELSIFRTGQPLVNREEIIEDANGERRWLLTTKVPLSDPGGQITGLVGIGHDITERLRAEEEIKQQADSLARSNTDLEQFAYVASHDLQEPLRMVSSYLQLIERRYKDKLDEDAHEFIGYAVDGANRMKKLINDLLTYSRVGTRAQPFVPTDCEAVLKQVLADMQTSIEEADALVTHDPLPTVNGDERQLAQLFQNLIGNAVKFRSEETPTIHISAAQEDDHWLFSVIDNGIGIDPQYTERIFIIFQRLHGVGTYPGTGIGLAISKRIVERHGGKIWPEQHPPHGTTFYFTIPNIGGES